MMKKRVTSIVAILLGVLLGVLLTGCSGTDPSPENPQADHTHSFDEWKTVKEASCTADGSRERSCSCGEVERETLPATGHSMAIGVCLVCGHIDEQELLEFATMQLVTLKKLPDGTYSVKATEEGLTAKQLAIPAEYEGKKITAIADGAFQYSESLTSIVLPDSITTIGKNAFANCPKLRSINLPDGVTEIGERAFYYCKALTKLEIPVATAAIGPQVFRYSGINQLTVAKGNLVYHSDGGCLIHTADKILIAGTKGCTIPDDGSVTKIGDGAFYGIWGISKLTVPEGVTEIGAEAFVECGDLLDLYLPASLTKPGERMVSGAKAGSLQNVHYAGTLNEWKTLTKGRYWSGASLGEVVVRATDQSYHDMHDHKPTGEVVEAITCNGGGIEIYACACGDRYEAKIPAPGHDFYAAECTRCGEKAPDGYFLEYELLPDGTWAVVGNGNKIMTDVLVIPATYQGKPVTVVADEAFHFDPYYEGLIIEEGVRYIGKNAFQDGYDLTFIELPESLVYIGESAFYNCHKIASLTIPAGVTEIGPSAFAECDGITRLTIPSTLQKLGGGAFGNCEGLKELVIEEGITEIGNGAFSGCKLLTEIIVPNSVTFIGSGAFAFCTKLKTLQLSENLTTIEDELVEWCEALKSLTIPASVTEIKGHFPFYSAAIVTLTIENPNIRIDSGAFNGGNTIKQIRFSGTIEQWKAVGSDYSGSFPVSCTVYCSDGSVRLNIAS